MKHAALVMGLSVAVAASAFGDDMFRGDPAHTGVYATAGPRQLEGVKWAFKTGGWVLSSPALSDGIVYVGSDDRNVYAVDAATGQEKWRFATGGHVRSSPAVVGGAVYVGSYDGALYALDAASGSLKWKFETQGEARFEARGLHGMKPRAQTIPDFWDIYLSSPAVTEGVVYFGSGDHNVYAVDAETGGLKWKFATQGVVHSSPAVADGRIYVGSWDTYLYALDAATGQERWKFKTGDDDENHNQTGIQSSPVVADGTVYFGCRDSHIYALDAQTGTERWKFKTTWVNASPAAHEGVVYAGTSIPTLFHALDARTGEERYTAKLGLIAFSSPAIADGLAYFGSFGGHLYAVDISDGKVVWEFQTEASRKNALGVVGANGDFDNKVVFTTDFFEEMYRTGAKIFPLGSIVSSPRVENGVVYVGSTDGNLYALQ